MYQQYIYYWLHNGQLEIYLLDVGQGDSFLLKSPQGKLGLVDAGKGSRVLTELGEVLPFGVRTIDFAIFTHADADHVEGFIPLLKRYEIETVFWNTTSKQTPIINELKTTIEKTAVKRYQLRADNDFVWGCCIQFDVIWPLTQMDLDNIEDENNKSIAFILKYKDFRFFAAGDLSKEFELKATVGEESTDIEVLKVGHHGSNTSTSKAFLSKFTPEFAFISVGSGNSYGHPHSEVLQVLDRTDTEVFRSDLHGRVKLVVQNNRVNFLTEKEVEKKRYTL